MHRVPSAIIALSSLAPLGVVAQDFQFMKFATRPKASFLPPPGGFLGYMAAHDFDGDGLEDLLMSRSGPRRSLFRRTPTGWIPSNLSGGSTRPLLVDLDSDGDRDVVGAAPFMRLPPYDPAAERFVVHENTPTGLSQVATPSFLVWEYMYGTAAGDIDADGWADLILAPTPGTLPSVVVARGAPGLQFTLDTTSVPPGLPTALQLEILDLDGDGDLDVLGTNATSGLRFLRNVGGSFVDATASLPPMRSGHGWMLALDLDGDGRTDCAAALANGDIDMLWGAPGGPTFAAAVATVPGIRGLYPGDFDGDGDLDLLAEHATGLDVVWNHGGRQFARTSVVGQLTALHGVADVDRDGKADIVFQPFDDGYLRCLFEARYEDPAFTLGFARWTDNATPSGVGAAGDVDGDGRTDLVTPGTAQVTVDRAIGGGAYRRSAKPFPPVAQGEFARSELGDVDGDGDLDFVAKDTGSLVIATNDGNGAFALSLQSTSPSPIGITDDLRLADVDGDGDLDIVLADSRGAVLVRNRGGGQFDPPLVLVPTPRLPPQCVEVADVDGDGDLDVVTDVLAASGSAHVVARNDGSGNFPPQGFSVANLGAAPTSVRAGDIDADGDIDLLVADDAPRVLRNNGTGSFTDTSLLDTPPNFGFIRSNLALADFDGDGDLDVSMVRGGTPPCNLLLNDGSGRFTDVTVARVANVSFYVFHTSLLRAADIDDDGDTDLLMAGGTAEHTVLANHLRQCRSTAALRLGGQGSFHLLSGPNFAQPGLALLAMGFAQPMPLQFFGLDGQLDLEPTTLQIIAAVATTQVGVSSVSVSVPQDPALFALEVWFQGGIVPGSGQPGFTNAVYELVLR